jgi:hypothetical protein
MIEIKSKAISIGDVYGRFTVLGVFKDSEKPKHTLTKVQCSCGSPARYVRTDTIKNGTSKSCGCLQKESTTKHGRWKHPLFKVWKSMVSRCTNETDRKYRRYGGRGITICERWQDLECFIEDMEPTYKQGMTIDRINNDGPYSKENCRWATKSQQNRNYSRNVILEHNGKRMCAADWAIELNISPFLLYDRLSRGWSAHDALTKPIQSKR